MKKREMAFMAIDQWGNTHHDLKHPRKDLMEFAGVKSASKMYVDTKDGKSHHVGYVVGKFQFRLYEVTPFRGRRDRS